MPPLPPPRSAVATAPTVAWLAITITITLGLGLGLAPGCSWTKKDVGPVDYGTSARESYEKGFVELRRENWLDAVKLFQFTRSRYGFSKWATLAQLGLADANFGREKYGEAIDGYRDFIKDHPTHERVQDGYAEFRIGEAYYKQIPSEWFLVPAAYEKDQGPVKDALRELKGFLAEYADSSFRKRAKEMEDDCVRRLADHELYVANFYLKRKKYDAALGRLEYLAKTFPGSVLEPEVLLILGRMYIDQDKPVEARRHLASLVEKHPQDFHARQAALYLAHIDERYGRPQPAAPPPEPARSPEPSAPEPAAPATP